MLLSVSSGVWYSQMHDVNECCSLYHQVYGIVRCMMLMNVPVSWHAGSIILLVPTDEGKACSVIIIEHKYF